MRIWEGEGPACEKAMQRKRKRLTKDVGAHCLARSFGGGGSFLDESRMTKMGNGVGMWDSRLRARTGQDVSEGVVRRDPD